jgi:hypothetical protein
VGRLNLPAVGPAQQDAAGVQADDLHQGLGGPLQEVSGADGALEDGQGTGGAFQQETHLVVRQLLQGAAVQRALAGEGGGAAGAFVELAEAVLIDGAVERDADGAAGQGECKGRPQLDGGFGQNRRPGYVVAFEGSLAVVADTHAAAG